MLKNLDLKATEIYIILTSVIFSIIALISGVSFHYQFIYIFSIFYILLLALVFRFNKKENLIRYILNVPPAYMLYSGVLPIIEQLHSRDLDSYLIKIDQWIFGVNPTEYLAQFSYPILTEYLQICYVSFFLLPVAIAIELLIKKREKQFVYLTRNIIFAFLFSYFLYFFVPAIGPRFTIHSFEQLGNELPGLFLTEHIRSFINYGGGITSPAIAAAKQVNRDCMPSGHTMMTAIYIYSAFKFNSKIKYFVLIIGSSLIFGTVYLRYHYVIDILAGLIFAAVSLILEKKIHKLLVKNIK